MSSLLECRFSRLRRTLYGLLIHHCHTGTLALVIIPLQIRLGSAYSRRGEYREFPAGVPLVKVTPQAKRSFDLSLPHGDADAGHYSNPRYIGVRTLKARRALRYPCEESGSKTYAGRCVTFWVPVVENRSFARCSPNVRTTLNFTSAVLAGHWTFPEQEIASQG